MNGPAPVVHSGTDAPFATYGPITPFTPVLLTVPHAGRHYPQTLIANARVDMGVLRRLEDRYADALVDGAVASGVNALVAHYARAWIDLNRAETAWDSALVDDATPVTPPDRRVRAGLGLVPRSLQPEGPLMLRRLHFAELEARIAAVHRPWHFKIAEGLALRKAQFGAAVLIDVHSMPTLSGGAPQVVIGDRHGLTASARLVDRLMAVVDGFGLPVARNSPYAGAYAIERHGRSAGPVEAVQIEVDRALYMAPDNHAVGDRVDRIRQLIVALCDAATLHCRDAVAPPMAAE